MLETDFKDDVLNAEMGGKRRYKQVANSDGTISLEDMTKYDQVGSDYGAGEINTLNKAVNESFSAKDLLKTKEEVAAVTVPGKGVDALVVKEINQSLSRKLNYANSKVLVNDTKYTAESDGIVIVSCHYDQGNYQGCLIENIAIVNVVSGSGMISAPTSHIHIFKGQQYSCSGTGSAKFIPYV